MLSSLVCGNCRAKFEGKTDGSCPTCGRIGGHHVEEGKPQHEVPDPITYRPSSFKPVIPVSTPQRKQRIFEDLVAPLDVTDKNRKPDISEPGFEWGWSNLEGEWKLRLVGQVR